jgi:hypothetical protein
MSLFYAGHHRASIGEVRLRNRADRLRRHDMPTLVAVGVWWAAAADWARIPWANMRAAFLRLVAPPALDPDCGRGGYPVCPTCRWDSHRGCGLLDDDPPCGCHCVAAEMGRRAYGQRERSDG